MVLGWSLGLRVWGLEVEGLGEKSDTAQGPSNLNQKSIFEDSVNFWRSMPIKWLQERTNGSKNAHGIAFEGPGVEPADGQFLSWWNVLRFSRHAFINPPGARQKHDSKRQPPTSHQK